MPTYQYACTACGQHLEVVQSFTDEPLTECPECTGRLRKVFSSVGIVFKGSGFYRNDSRAGNGGNGSGPAKEAKEKDSSTKDSAGKDSSGSKDAGGKSGEGSTNGGGKNSTSATSSSSGSTSKAGATAS